MGASTPEFARLFMVPGMSHCGGGIGTSTFDRATALVRWVEEASPSRHPSRTHCEREDGPRAPPLRMA